MSRFAGKKAKQTTTIKTLRSGYMAAWMASVSTISFENFEARGSDMCIPSLDVFPQKTPGYQLSTEEHSAL